MERSSFVPVNRGHRQDSKRLSPSHFGEYKQRLMEEGGRAVGRGRGRGSAVGREGEQ